jgi:hypothetical protein
MQLITCGQNHTYRPLPDTVTHTQKHSPYIRTYYNCQPSLVERQMGLATYIKACQLDERSSFNPRNIYLSDHHHNYQQTPTAAPLHVTITLQHTLVAITNMGPIYISAPLMARRGVPPIICARRLPKERWRLYPLSSARRVWILISVPGVRSGVSLAFPGVMAFTPPDASIAGRHFGRNFHQITRRRELSLEPSRILEIEIYMSL